MSQQPNSHEAMKTGRNEKRRERDVFLLYGAAFRDIPHVDNAGSHVPRLSVDSTLTALCQLTAIRMGAQRAMISLLDDERQHILAEATCDISLRPEAPGDASSTLWFGNVSIPRSLGLCEKILDFNFKEDRIVIIGDLSADATPCVREDIKNDSRMRFYASVALVSPNGATVGALCLFDDKPRDGLSKAEITLFRDMASTVVDYLDTYTTKDQYGRGERFTRGLVSFAEGASALIPFERGHRRGSSAAPQTPGLSSRTDGEAFSLSDTRDAKDLHGPNQTTRSRSPVAPKPNRARAARHRSIRSLQNSILPNDSKSMFSRAANVMMASSDLDGVLILDASVAANGDQRRTNGSGTELPSESYQSRSSSDEGSSNNTEDSSHVKSSSSKICQLLGVATPNDGDAADYGMMLESDLARLFREYPHGKVFTYTSEGLSLSSTEEGSSSPSVTEHLEPPTHSKRKTKERPRSGSVAIQAMFPKARSVAFIPFWDFERSRWFAGCLCWSNDAYRLLSSSVDLAYFKIFSNSIMRELSRLDAVTSNQAKTTFVASISHELRSPLHGIIGTLEFIKDTALDSFQVSMLNSLHACGTTLLDTINHVMDYAKITESNKGISSKRLKNANTIRLSSKPVKSRKRRDASFDLGIATEEVVEAIFSGSSYIPVASKLMDDPLSPTEEEFLSLPKRKARFIILDVAHEDDWVFSFPIGSWRRIVMNLFGNAVKYTETGFIHITLRSSSIVENSDAPTLITLTITDTGLGMSPGFLANRAFQPFSQENPHSPGTGLGLSIVRQILDMSGGKIEVSSDPSVGSKVTVKFALNKQETSNALTTERAQFLSFLPRLKGRRICVLCKELPTPSPDTTIPRTEEGLVRFTNALVDTLEHHLKMEVVKSTEWEGHDADLVICPELSFDYLSTIRRHRGQGQRAPVTIFIGMDALEAATLRSDVRVTSRESVVEIITQPCGPYKLAFVLNRCLDRYDHPEENLQRAISPNPFPQFVIHEDQLPRSLCSSPTSTQGTTGLFESSSPGPTVKVTPASSVAQSSAVSQHEDDSIVSSTLIVDDNMLNRRLLVAFMRKNKLSYQEASNGLEAVEMYKDESCSFDTILMDMSMPVLDGMSATRAIRDHERANNTSRCCIIALTGLASSSAKLEAWSSGIDHFLTKPVNYKELREILRSEEAQRQARRRDEASGTIESGRSSQEESGQ
ncbi:sensor histidine kinase response [Pyrenophora tritici-repentis]|nr:sensor histidine kinase response [Pyrenophora tritici-repentis]KAI0592670.1 sensor histidine kinase response [Pyrenophora tritici-repentis]KAI1544631.1 BaeS Signal transduction histidine kinase [Pyrenophora tritici-repentis]KAI1579253.1 BaeS Signal transduction histidine kinase [Pyrenophora tritici-repentis]KAI1589002.1 BaeS Signal transduction histidine kinase [Pyrenophora tritici-repentis]